MVDTIWQPCDIAIKMLRCFQDNLNTDTIHRFSMADPAHVKSNNDNLELFLENL